MNELKLSLQQEAYREGRNIDNIINELLNKYSPKNIENYLFWKVFIRIIQTELNIIEELIEETYDIHRTRKETERLMDELKEINK